MAVARIFQGGAEDDGIYHIHNSLRAAAALDGIHAAIAGTTGETLGGAGAATQNGALGEYGKPIDRCRADIADRCIGNDAIIIGQIDGVVALIVRDRLHIYVNMQKLCTSGFDRAGAIQDGLGISGKIDSEIFDAVFIPAAVGDFFRMNADSFTNVLRITSARSTGQVFV